MYQIDGKDIFSIEDFFAQIWPLLAEVPSTGNANLDAFNDVLSWPEEPYTLIWKNADLSREQLGYPEMARKLERMLQTCHPANVANVQQRLERARRGEGPTLFDELVELIRHEQNAPFVTLLLD